MGSNTINESADIRRVLDAIRQIVRSLRVASSSAQKRVGLSAAQLFVLQRLGAGPAMSLNELAERTFTHQSSASVVVSRLVERGLVQRDRSPEDGRRQVLSLTPAARTLLGGAPDVAQDRLIAALQSMKRSDVRKLAELMDAFLAAAGLADGTPALFFEDDRPARSQRK